MVCGKLNSLAREIEQPIAQLKEIKRSLRMLPHSRIDWPKYRKWFEKAHPQFRARLLEHAPELSEDEISLAIMLRIELRMPDIARMLHRSLRDSRELRLGLKAKLGIPIRRSELPFLKIF
jgi:hypothetical protein